MTREEILMKAQNGKDEREEQVTIQSYKTAGSVSFFIIAVMTLFVAVDGLLLESQRVYDSWNVLGLLLTPGMFYGFIFYVNQFIQLKNRKHILEAIPFALILGLALHLVLNIFM